MKTLIILSIAIASAYIYLNQDIAKESIKSNINSITCHYIKCNEIQKDKDSLLSKVDSLTIKSINKAANVKAKFDTIKKVISN